MKRIDEIIKSDAYTRLNIARKSSEQTISKWVYREKSSRRNKLIRKYFVTIPEVNKVTLTREEQAAAKSMWAPLGRKFNLRWHTFYKHFGGKFCAEYVPEDIWNHIELALNSPLLREALQHKVLSYQLLPQGVFPTPIGAIVNSSPLDASLQHSDWKSLEIALRAEPVVVMKRAMGDGGGKGVTLLEWEKMSDHEIRDFVECLPQLKHDYIFQKFMRVHPDMAQFNPASSNTIRMITLNINGRATLLSSFMRMARDNRFNDNASDGGVYVSVHHDGSLHDYAITNGFASRCTESPTGIQFSGHKLSQYPMIVEQCLNWHRSLPYMGFIAWDVTLDEEGHVRLMEINLNSQETTDHQAFNGPLFGDRTLEVIQYVVDNPPKRLYTY